MNLIQEILQNYIEAVKDADRKLAINIIEAGIKHGITPEQVVFEIVIPAVKKMLEDLLDSKTIALSQHFIASKVAEEITEMMIPRFEKIPTGKGIVVIGSSFGDFHGLGKKIVSGCLRANMYTVHDLGLNVSPEQFVNEAQKHGANIIGISSMMVHTAKGEKGALGIRKLLRERNLENSLKIIVGGAPYQFHDNLYQEVGADAWAKNGIEAVDIINTLINEV